MNSIRNHLSMAEKKVLSECNLLYLPFFIATNRQVGMTL